MKVAFDLTIGSDAYPDRRMCWKRLANIHGRFGVRTENNQLFNMHMKNASLVGKVRREEASNDDTIVRCRILRLRPRGCEIDLYWSRHPL